jgi:hypothetical protein
MAAPSEKIAPHERRAYPRVPTAIPAAINILTGEGARPCVVTDLSASGAGVEIDGDVPPPERVCRLDISWFGTFEGITVREGANFFGVRFAIGEAEREHLIAKLAKYVEIGLSPATGEDEIAPGRPHLTVRTMDGVTLDCDVQDITLDGVLLKSDIRPQLGELIRVGNLYGRVESLQDDGMAIVFVDANRPGAPPPAF